MKHEPLRKFLSAVICDLAASMANAPDPIIIGGQYGGEKLYRAIAAWALERQLNLKDPDVESWLVATATGVFNETSAK